MLHFISEEIPHREFLYKPFGRSIWMGYVVLTIRRAASVVDRYDCWCYTFCRGLIQG
ncbi:MAG: hypothetical protein ACLFVA_01220 [Dehalococcoidia bacterium]